MNNFKLSLQSKIKLSLSNNYGVENYDEYRFGKLPIILVEKIAVIKRIKRKIKKLIGYKKIIIERQNIDIINNEAESIKNAFESMIQNYGVKLRQVFELLNIENQNLLVDIIAYRILGYKKVKLPLNNKKYWDAIEIGNSLVDKNDTYDPHFMHFILEKCDLNKIGYNIQLYFSALGVVIDFIFEQYAYKSADKTIVEVEKGDIILDVGACWGDTALYFASKTGELGKVYSFEFIPDNIKIFNLNIDLNPTLKNQIELVQHPVSNKSETKIYFKDNGPGSIIEFEPFEEQTGYTTTLSIDDFVTRNKISKVDFIKMDIEGAEPIALEGAIETIKKHKPKLAIAIYHSMDDMVNIPNWINDLNLGYKLYLGHYTIHAEETVIFAKVEQ